MITTDPKHGPVDVGEEENFHDPQKKWRQVERERQWIEKIIHYMGCFYNIVPRKVVCSLLSSLLLCKYKTCFGLNSSAKSAKDNLLCLLGTSSIQHITTPLDIINQHSPKKTTFVRGWMLLSFPVGCAWKKSSVMQLTSLPLGVFLHCFFRDIVSPCLPVVTRGICCLWLIYVSIWLSCYVGNIII